MTRWQVEQRFGDALELFQAAPYELVGPTAVFCSVSRPALVLGNGQRSSLLCWREIVASNLQVVRRRSGGGGVLIAPDQQVWVELWIPHKDLLWQEDVLKAAVWLGNAWASSLTSLGVSNVSVHTGRMMHTRWSGQICFAGLGPGEVSIDEHKAVGIAQRRTREGVMFECSALLGFDAETTVALMLSGEEERKEALIYLERTVYPGNPWITKEELEESFLDQILALDVFE